MAPCSRLSTILVPILILSLLPGVASDFVEEEHLSLMQVDLEVATPPATLPEKRASRNIPLAGPAKTKEIQAIRNEVEHPSHEVGTVSPSATVSLRENILKMEKDLLERVGSSSSSSATPLGESVQAITALINSTMMPVVLDLHQVDQELLDHLFGAFADCSGNLSTAILHAEGLNTTYRQHSTLHQSCRGNESILFEVKTTCEANVTEWTTLKNGKCELYEEVNTRARNVDAHKLLMEKPHDESTLSYLNRIAYKFCDENGLLEEYRTKKERCDWATGVLRQTDEDCDRKIEEYNTKKGICDNTMETMRFGACEWALNKKTACDNLDSCYSAALIAYQEAEALVKKQESDRKIEWRALKRIDCLLDVFANEGNGPDANKIENCKLATHSTNHLDISYYTPPPKEVCTDVSAYPGTGAFYDIELLVLPENIRPDSDVIVECPLLTSPDFASEGDCGSAQVAQGCCETFFSGAPSWTMTQVGGGAWSTDVDFIRFDFANSVKCNGTADLQQSGSATLMFDEVADTEVILEMIGMAESQYEKFEMYFDDTLEVMVQASNVEGGCQVATCQMCAVNMPEKILMIPSGQHTLRVEVDSIDPQWHHNAYFKIYFWLKQADTCYNCRCPPAAGEIL